MYVHSRSVTSGRLAAALALAASLALSACVSTPGAVESVRILVTEVDLECEHMCRAVLAERFPDHDVLAEELGATSPATTPEAAPRLVALPSRIFSISSQPSMASALASPGRSA